MLSTFLSSFVAAFVTLFIVIDPIMVTPIFAALTQNDSRKKQRRIALQASLIAAGVLTFFALLGSGMLHHLGISMAAFRTAGGILLFLMGFRMFFEPEGELDAKTPGPKASARDNIAFFPIALPLLAGPGAIATIMLLMNGEDGISGAEKVAVQAGALTAVYATLLTGLVIMAFAGRIAHALGRTGMNMISRLLGMLLMALSTQYIFDGVRIGILERVAA
ncbi:MarC family protein [Parvularcula sp. IMCC14364]|uniref:MarC family protein n=1 Tax=Parvularcula sp. IMCC14364 TaxID=3067902 RepID=UPI00274048E6|nr:MarC family protein [Parvularcula sp. IMCC14364]